MNRTAIKICGLTRPQDMLAALDAGADAVGLVFYRLSSRYVTIEQAVALARLVPPSVCLVGLFVNAMAVDVKAVLNVVPLDLLQFHGDDAYETEAYCKQFGKPYLKAARMAPDLDLIEYASRYPSAQALLLDAFVEGYGGGGKTFDWSLIPKSLPLPIVLSGGLNPDNVTEAIRIVRPAGVDVSSGVEQSKGIKDAAKITAFIAGVKKADV
ncbi:MAG TPA: phosphoribosylanthranilate isomerase [Rhodocyclaceae bacterium]|jgi:phosphoribosylanthranilate isomerase|nr:phosphoribosylanthranilate isomerase [Rhodocyclaceae bacterium]